MTTVTAPAPGTGHGTGPAHAQPLRGPVVPVALILLTVLTAGFGALVIESVDVQPVLVAGAIAGIAFAVTIAVRPDAATFVTAAILYSNAATVAVRLHDVPFFAGAAFPALLVVPFISYVLLRDEPVVVTPVFRLLLVFLLVQIVSTIVSEDVPLAFENVMTFVTEGILIYFLFTNVIRNERTLWRVVWLVVIIAGVLGGLSLLQATTDTYRDDFLGFAQVTDASVRTGQETLLGEVREPRQAGPIGEQNRYAQILVVLIPLGMLLAGRGGSLPTRAAALGLTALIAAGVVLTYSRGAVVGLALVVALMAVVRILTVRQIGALVLGFAVLLAVQPAYATRVESIVALTDAVDGEGIENADGVVQSRVTETVAALLVYGDHPIVGVGPGLYQYHYRDYADEIALNVRNEDRRAHNLYASVAAETGTLGLVTLLAIFLVSLASLGRVRNRWRTERPDLSILATGFMLAIATYMTTGLFLHLAFERYLWFLLALAGATVVVADRLARETAEGSA